MMLVYCVNDWGRQKLIHYGLDIDNAKRIAVEYAYREGVFPFGYQINIDDQSIGVSHWRTTFSNQSQRVYELMLVDRDSYEVFDSAVLISEFEVQEAN